MSVWLSASCNCGWSRRREALFDRRGCWALVRAWLPFIALACPTVQAEPWTDRADNLRREMRKILVLPTERIALDGQVHQALAGEGYRIDSITYASEPGSRVTALLYLPTEREGRVPAVVVACGHGGSKSALYAQYAGQLYAKMGFACLVPDTIGEEERHVDGQMGARGHDLYHLGAKNPEFVKTKLKRSVLGKIVWDLMRGIDYLETRPEVDANRIGIIGYSLGGTSAGCVACLDGRIDAAVICGWAFSKRFTVYGKYCTRLPYVAIAKVMGFDEMTALVAPRSATLFMLGDSDAIIDPDGKGKAVVADLRSNVTAAKRILADAGIAGVIETEIEPGADHRPYFLTRRSVEWMQTHLMAPAQRRPVPRKTVRYGDWVDGQGQKIEKLYNHEARARGLEAVDIGAVYARPKKLACFPDRQSAGPAYTMTGWVAATARADATR